MFITTYIIIACLFSVTISSDLPFHGFIAQIIRADNGLPVGDFLSEDSVTEKVFNCGRHTKEPSSATVSTTGTNTISGWYEEQKQDVELTWNPVTSDVGGLYAR